VGVAAVFTALVGVLAFTGSSPASADNGTPGCVAKAEFRQLRRGMTPTQVQRLFGTKGKTTYTSNYAGYRYVSREYRPCVGPPYSFVDVNFSANPRQALRVDGKFAYWG
jgi:hypothetical protein